jgi:hypothetical protein
MSFLRSAAGDGRSPPCALKELCGPAELTVDVLTVGAGAWVLLRIIYRQHPRPQEWHSQKELALLAAQRGATPALKANATLTARILRSCGRIT